MVIATGRRMAYTAPLFERIGLRADTPLITSNGAVTRTLGGEDRRERRAARWKSRVARGLCGLLRPFGCVVFTFDRPGRGELVVEDLEQAHGRIRVWVEANRNAIEVVKPLEDALAGRRRSDSGHGGGHGEPDARGRGGGEGERVGRPVRRASGPSIRRAGCRFWICCRRGSRSCRRWKNLAARLGVESREAMAIGDNWNDVEMLEWAGQAVVMGNAAQELRTLAKMRGWKQAPPNDQDGVAVVLEAAIRKCIAAGLTRASVENFD